MLKAIPNKNAGFIILLTSIFTFFFFGEIRLIAAFIRLMDYNNGFSFSSLFFIILSFLWIGAQFPQEKFLFYGRILTLYYYFLLMCILSFMIYFIIFGMKLYFILLMKSHIESYPCPLQINSFWNLGFLSAIIIILQIITGIFLGLHYTSDLYSAYSSVFFFIIYFSFQLLSLTLCPFPSHTSSTLFLAPPSSSNQLSHAGSTG